MKVIIKHGILNEKPITTQQHPDKKGVTATTNYGVAGSGGVLEIIKRVRQVLPASDNIGFIYVWFAQVFPRSESCGELAKSTTGLTFHLIPTSLSYSILAVWETLIGVLLILNFSRRIVIQMALE